MRIDLILLHPPSVYDFRKRTILFGPISDLIPSSPVFEMYPIGFVSLADYLERSGFRVRIVNLAVRMMQDEGFDVEKEISSLSAPIFGIDLHWLPHAHGAIEIARIVKEKHPASKVVIGGLSATYFCRELLNYPQVDYVLRGDSTEEPLRQLVSCVIKGGELGEVPNLIWRERDGKVVENRFSYVPQDLNDVMVRHYDYTISSVIRYRSLSSYLPFYGWLNYPITAVLTCRGCTRNCVFCGGSNQAMKFYCSRDKPVYRPPKAVFQDVINISHFTNGPVFILGDLRQPGEDYAEELFSLMKKKPVKNQLILELFYPARAEYLRKMGEACPGFCLEISPESHDQAVRYASGKNYSNESLEDTLKAALEAGCGRLDVFFMIGLPQQTAASVMETVEYGGKLLKEFKADKRLSFFISPLAPFLDPGSIGFENADKFGYRVLFRSLEEHRRAMLAPLWKYALNYETQWLNRNQIMDVTYQAGMRLNNIKRECGIIDVGTAEKTEKRISDAINISNTIDGILSGGDQRDREGKLALLREAAANVSMSTVCEKQELNLRVGWLKFKPLSALKSLILRR